MLKSIKAGCDDLSWTRFATAPSLSLSLQDIVLVDMEVVLDKMVIRKEYERASRSAPMTCCGRALVRHRCCR